MTPFRVSGTLAVADQTDTDITVFFQFPDRAFIKNGTGNIVCKVADYDVGGSTLDLNLVIVGTDEAVDYVLKNTGADPGASIIEQAPIDAQDTWLDVGGLYLGIEIEAAGDGTPTAGAIEFGGEFSVGVKDYS
jgi:hypothetical protein